MKKIAVCLMLFGLLINSGAARDFEPDTTNQMELDVKRAILLLLETDPGFQDWFDNSAGYAVFPSVGKGGFFIGGAFGRGLVIVDGRVDGYTSLTQGSIGLQFGGQKYAQFVFFRDETALGHFRRGNFEFGAQASAVAVTAGASADANYNAGVAVFTSANGGLMIEGSVGGQRFTYEARNSE
jgi:lipid-binding SYLF domain-containing protein